MHSGPWAAELSMALSGTGAFVLACVFLPWLLGALEQMLGGYDKVGRASALPESL